MDEYCKILVVDDEFIMRQGITHMIDWEKEGFQVIGQASNGKEALEIIKKHSPNIVISDVVMPQMDGVELTKFIQENYPEIQIIILSSYSDFEYVKSSFKYGAVDYILKPTLNPTELLKTLKKVSSKIPNLTTPSNNITNASNIISRLIHGFDINIDLGYVENTYIHPTFCLFGINAKVAYDSQDKRNKMIDFIIAQINKNFSSEDVFQVVRAETEIIILVINFKNEEYSSLEKKLTKIANTVGGSFPEAFFVLSEKFKSLLNIKGVYEKDFVPLTKQYFYNKNNHLLTSESYKDPSPVEKFNFKGFSEAVAIMQISSAFEMLTQYIKDAITNKSLTEFELKTLIQNSFYNVITTLESLNFDTTTLNSLKHQYFDRIYNSKYAEDLIATYEDLLKDFSEVIDKYQNKINSHMINKITQYVYTHYNEQLTLSDVSKLFNFNYHYLSSYFSLHNKEGFNEFLNKIRIEKACDFLKQDIPISDISSMVGYSDHSYFCKVFKKFTGLTPSNFRKGEIKF
ncbi:response regulator transcription factor [Clostridium cellulovorans]|uniref:Stage 0 sporulation protein A homolog n=1 Tax=Clostridium cellulovorans (strain ATCC 35296 / DSM 3052 / OCM 3 / 743B) TaxID=573061 RepID=D9SM88_CLOC7|nr:response regulator [Clostridium cellulovorans]ADL53744.1 two component transcriptional regulator, AraC family [Clostridium cellulovorans 743B]